MVGFAALIWSTEFGTGNSSVRNRIEGTADKITGTGKYWIYGRVNALAAMGQNLNSAPLEEKKKSSTYLLPRIQPLSRF